MTPAIAMEWLQKASNIPLGHKMYIPCVDRESQKRSYKALLKAKLKLTSIDPTAAATLQIGKALRNGAMWVVITRLHSDPRVGFVENPAGKVERVYLQLNKEIFRRAFLMKEEGHTTEEIIEMLTPELSPEQQEEIKTWLTTDSPE